MKLLRHGPSGAEKPGLMHTDGTIRDLSGIVSDIGWDTLSDAGLAAIRAVDAASQTVLLRAEVGKGAETLRPGQVVEVEIAAPSGQHQRLPASALARNQGVTIAFVQVASDDKGATFDVRPVRVVSQGGDSVMVDGIKAGERVAIKGVSGLKAMLTGVGKE